jgi:hypothetical protein
MKRNIHTPLTDEYLKSIERIKNAEADPYFYSRLKAKMERGRDEKVNWVFQLKPALIVTVLSVFLFINGFVVYKQIELKKSEVNSTALKNFANSYNLTVSNY